MAVDRLIKKQPLWIVDLCGGVESTDTAGFNDSTAPNVVYQNRSPFSYLDTYFDTRTYRNGCPFFAINPSTTNRNICKYNKNRLCANISAIAEPVSLYSRSNPRPIFVKSGVKNPPRDVKSNDSPPTYSQCVSPSHPRTQTSSPHHGGRWRALP